MNLFFYYLITTHQQNIRCASHWSDQSIRPCLLQMPSMQQYIQVCCRCAFYIWMCTILPDLGVLKNSTPHDHLKCVMCAKALTRLKRQGLHWCALFLEIKKICNMLFKGAWSFLFSFFSKLLRFWYHKNCHIFLIIILKFHTLIPLHLEENCKNSPILLIWW